MTSTNLKTRMCRYMRRNGSCRNMESCNFAHTIEELTPMKCRDGDNCRYVSIATDTGYYHNFGGRVCEFIHPDESFDNFCVRLDIKNLSDRISEERRSNRHEINTNQLYDRIDNLESTVKTLVMVIKELNKKIDNMTESMGEAVEEEVVEEDEGFIDDVDEEESEYTPSVNDEEVLYAEDAELDSLVKTDDEESGEDEESVEEEKEDIEGEETVEDEDYTPSVGSEDLYREDKRYNVYVVAEEDVEVANTLVSIRA